MRFFFACLLLAASAAAQSATLWRATQLDAIAADQPVRLRSGGGYSITLTRLRRSESHPATSAADHILWVRAGTVNVTAGKDRARATAGDLIRIPARTAWTLRPQGGRVELVDISVDPIPEGQSAPEGIRPAPGRMGLHVSKTRIDALIRDTEANAPLHIQDNFTANIVLFKGRVGPWESHAGCTDIYLLQTGDGVIQTGGLIENAREASPGEPRGTAITGSRDLGVAGGDLLVISRNAAHHMNPRTLPLAYVLIKVWSE